MEKKSKSNVKVSVWCITFNHENYIRQCLDGLVNQKTIFSYEIIVHDDASSDGTANIIRDYAEKYSIIVPILQTENQYSKHDGSLLKILTHATRGEYIAMCEGDDYWIDPNKLQEQVDYLENHPDCGLTYGKVNKFSQIKKKIVGQGGDFVSDYNDLLINGNRIPTPSVLFRSILNERYWAEIGFHDWMMSDYPQWLYIAKNTKIHFENKVYATYRVLNSSASHFSSYEQHKAFEDSLYNIRLFFVNKYGADGNDKSLLTEQYNKALFRVSYQHKNYKSCLDSYKVIQIKDIKIRIKYFISLIHCNFL